MKIFKTVSWGILLVGLIFRLVHWPGSAILYILGTGLLFLFGLIYFILNSKKNRLSAFFQLCVSVWMMRLLFSLMYWQPPFILFWICVVATVSYLTLLFLERKKVGLKSLLGIAFIAALYSLGSLRAHHTYYFFNLNETFNKESRKTNYIAWDKYSWFKYTSGNMEEALEANDHAQLALENYRKDYSIGGSNISKKLLLENRNKIISKRWMQYERIDADWAIQKDEEQNSIRQKSLYEQIELSKEAKSLIGYWLVDSILQNHQKIDFRSENFTGNVKWRLGNNSFINKIEEFHVNAPYGRFNVKENIFYHYPLDSEKVLKYKIIRNQDQLLLEGMDAKKTSIYLQKSEEPWDEEVRGPKPKK